jgi:hypothetical protein
MRFSFLSYLMPFSWKIPTYSEYFLTKADLTFMYSEFRLLLQLLQHRDRLEGRNQRTKRWLLKSPGHIVSLDALVQVFPDATIIQTVRDPLKMVGSYISLTGLVRSHMKDSVDAKALGKAELQRLVRGMHIGEKARKFIKGQDTKATFYSKTYGPRFVDVPYKQMVKDPAQFIEALYAKCDMKVTPEIRANFASYLAQNRQHRHGKHVYSYDTFGLTEEEVKDKFKVYYEAYGV